MSSRPRVPLLGAVVASLAAIIHGGLFLLARRPDVRRLAGDEITYFERAARLLAGREEASELLWPPLYPRLLAALERLASRLRPVDAWHLAELELVQTAMLAAAATCAALLARHLGIRREGAALVALGVVAFPPLAAYAHYLWPEVVHLLFFLAALLALVEAGAVEAGAVEVSAIEAGARHGPQTCPQTCPQQLRPRHWSRRLMLCAAGGVLLGLALLTKSLLTGFVPVLLLAVWVDASWLDGHQTTKPPPTTDRLRIGRWLRRALAPLAVVLGLGLVVAPTLVDNHRATGLWVVADSSAFNLWVGLQDDARRNHLDSIAWDSLEAYRAAGPDAQTRRAFARAEIEALVARQGVFATVWRQLSTQYFRLFHRESYFTDQLPGGLLAAAGSGYLATPRPLAIVLRAVCWGLYAALLVAAAWGLVHQGSLGAGSRAVWRWVLVAFLVYNLLLFFGLHVKTRYRVPLLPLWMIWAAQGLETPPWRIRWHEPRARRRALLAAALALVVLVLAFGAAW